MFDVNAELLRKCLAADLNDGLVPMVASSPGMGKSDIIRDIARAAKRKVIDLRVSQLEPVDMQGFPGVVDGRMTFYPPEYFPLEGDPLPEGYKGWLLFLDEFNSGNKQTEAAAYRLILDREVYKHKLHPMCSIVAAGNLVTDRAITNTMSTATTSRLTHYRMIVDHKVWINWANTHDIDHRVISYIKFKPDSLHKFNPATSELTFPCPRTWHMASKIVTRVKEIDEVTKIRLAGTIGEGAAVEFSMFTQIYQNLPTIEQILDDPKRGWRVPTEASEQYAITTILSHNLTTANIDKIITAIKRLPIEFQVITFKDIYKRSPELQGHALIHDWISDHSSQMF